MIKFKKKKECQTISAHVSDEIVNMLEYLMAIHGISKSKVVEQILAHHMQSMIDDKENLWFEEGSLK